MINSIILDKEEGINAKIALCPRCGEDSNALLLLGNKGYAAYCPGCSKNIMGVTQNQGTCPNCKDRNLRDHSKMEDRHVASNILCDTCETETKEHEEIVKAGGIYWKCSKCNSSGVIKKNSFADFIRKEMKIKPPKPVGCDFEGQEQCPMCNNKAQNKES